MEKAWLQLRSGRSELKLAMFMQAPPFAAYWSLSFLMFLLDWLQPRWAKACKCQPDAKPDFALMRKVCLRVLSHQLTIYPLATAALWPLLGRRLSFSKKLPSASIVARQFALFTVLTEIFFYYQHRFLHHPKLYPRIHKIHHEVKAPFGACAVYFHPIESGLTVLQALLPPALMRAHVLTYCAWATAATSQIVFHHSGYELPYNYDKLPSFDTMTLQHDDHHKRFDVCFGVLGVLDWLHDTGAKHRSKEGKEVDQAERA